MNIESILNKNELTKSDIVTLLLSEGKDEAALFEFSAHVKQQHVGNEVFLRGLIEFSNYCDKDCYYCGIRGSNDNVCRYFIPEEEILRSVEFAYQSGFGSLALQSGEMQSKSFTEKVNDIVKKSMAVTNNEIGITLSCGEQTDDVYKQWFESGAIRYLLRIETSNRELYKKLHPDDVIHTFEKRIDSLQSLKKIGYQTGTGVMIGLPFQTIDDLAEDLLFLKQFDIDMCGMGPYIEHRETPLFAYQSKLLPLKQRLNLSMKMIAVLRILMSEINIAATTALQAIDQNGRIRAIEIGANVLMPNITPKKYRDDYFLYENKPVASQNDEDSLSSLEEKLNAINHRIAYHKQGNSLHYRKEQDDSAAT